MPYGEEDPEISSDRHALIVPPYMNHGNRVHPMPYNDPSISRNELLSSASNINNLPLLLTFVSPSSPPQHVLESLLSLHSFFLPLLPQLPSSSATANTSSSDNADADQSEFIYLTWLRSKFDEFLKSLIDVLVSDQSDETLKEVVLDTLMEFVKVANGGTFHSSLYNRIISSI
ncbi:hypothetical protein RYX36_000459, partial [Vicia faba]